MTRFSNAYALRASRRTDADHMANQMVEAIQARAEKKYSLTNPLEINAFTVGYLSSLLAQVAATSPAAMKELAGAVKFAKQ